MPDNISEELRNIEKEIDEHYKLNPLVKLSYCQAVWHLLAYFEDLALYLIHGSKNLSMHETGAIVDNLINDLKHPLYWLFKECPKEGSINPTYNEQTYQDCTNFSILAHNYLAFESAYIYGSHDIVTLSLENHTIYPRGKVFEGVQYEAYNRLLEQHELRPDINSLDILKIIAFNLKIQGNGFHYRITKRLLQKVIDAMQQVHIDIFELPDHWNLGNYTLKEFRQMFNYLMARSFIHFLARNLAADKGCEHLGYSTCLILISKKDLIWEIMFYSNVGIKVATHFIEDMTYGERGINNPDPALQPLINVETNKYIIAPSLILGSSGERNLITLLNRIPEERHIYLELVQEKEDWLRRKIKETITIPNIRYFNGKIPGKKSLPDIDLAIISDEEKIVFVTELKWFISPSEPREVIEKSIEIQTGISQSSLLEQEYLNNPALFSRLLNIDDTYTLMFLVLSTNYIGQGVNQCPNIPVLKVEHFIRKLNTENSFSSILNWLIIRDYLPIEGKDYKIVQVTSQIADWKVSWYGLQAIRGDKFL